MRHKTQTTQTRRIFHWIFLYKGEKQISLDHGYNLLSIIPPKIFCLVTEKIINYTTFPK